MVRNLDGSGTSWTSHSIMQLQGNNAQILVTDVDGDGDMDVFTAPASLFFQESTDDGNSDFTHPVWYENMDGVGNSWTKHTIDPTATNVHSVLATDVDGDGDMDIVGASFVGGVWWIENVGDSGRDWAQHPIDENPATLSVAGIDVDGNGDIDYLTGSLSNERVAW